MQQIDIPDTVVLKGQTIRGFHALPRSDAERLHAGLLAQANECGCHAGGIGALVSVGLYLAAGIGLPILLARPVTAGFWAGIGILVGGGVAGKCVGLWRAHRRFEALRRDLEALVENPATPGSRAARKTDSTGDFTYG